jgi:nucleoside-diphosphate-sugar epimerase
MNRAVHLFSPYAGRRALVLGASGFIGRWVTRALSRAGATVTALVRDPEATARVLQQWGGASAQLLRADLTDLDALADLVDQAAPDITFNLAGYGIDRAERDGDLLRRINGELPGVLASLLARGPASSWSGYRLVHTGSALEYGEIRGNLDETGPVNPTTSYGITKYEGTMAVERCAATTGILAITARLFTVYGAGEHDGRLLPTLVAATQHEGDIPLSAGLQRRDFTYVGDVAEGLLRLGLVAGPAGWTVNLATGALLTVREFAETAARVLPLRPGQLHFGALPDRPDEMQHDRVTIARLKQLISWSPPTAPAEGIRRTRDILLQGRWADS